MDWFINFLKSTEYIMETPALYGWFHLAFLFGGACVIALLVWWLKDKSPKTKNWVVFGAGLFLLLLEVYKQLYFTYVVYDHYAWYAFPLQLCSTPMYLALISAFLKPSNVKTGLQGYMSTYGLMGGLVVMMYPGDVFTEHLSISIHTMLWHLTLVFIGVYLLASKQFGTKKGDFKKAFITFLTMVVFIIGVDTVGYYLLNPAGSTSIITFNMFFISPFYNTTLPVLGMFQNISYVLFVLAYLLSATAAAFIFYGCFLALKKIKWKTKKIK